MIKVKPQLALLRAMHGKISQSELSRQTGITQKQLSALEAGKTKGITFDILIKLCTFFSCTPNDLLKLEADSPTVEELKKADEIIARGLKRAMEAQPRHFSDIWAEFDAVRSRIANNASVSDE
ncbi:helix-turn-helix domain-containing protein [Gloeocapsopsis sp. IPPAS B-1203]|uniref:helix-turn-helix domain-containing protein n=1 Tax=Gloeocapsopsis sp. IPPAS B-1203 TaxID=2049454 RepID=UPI0025A06C18|nr:helix-turn-helix domain-containing protein [Gloeocapsopsis sp. IPPAS B-1203]